MLSSQYEHCVESAAVFAGGGIGFRGGSSNGGGIGCGEGAGVCGF
jgi:hypothetical protein